MSVTLLIHRLEAATGPDRDLDMEIFALSSPSVSAAREHWTPEQCEVIVPHFTDSIDQAVWFTARILPGWAWRVATCSVSDDAWVFPDFNSPEHGERLQREFDPALDWSDLTDIDLRPSGRPAIALIISVLKAKLIIGGEA